jgi:ferredoxin-like protein FixX
MKTKKDEVSAIFENVRRNAAMLAACPGHIFTRVEPDRVFSKYRCTVCGGTVDTTQAHWYDRGMAHGRALR